MTVTVRFFHIEAPVSVSVPPDTDVVDLNHAYSSVDGPVSRLGGDVKGLVDRI